MQPLEAINLSNAFGYLSNKEVHGIRFLAALLPDNALCINIGAGTGTSALAFLEARPDLAKTFWTIDISTGGPHGGLQNEINAFNNARMIKPNHILHDSNTVSYPLYMNMTKPVFDYVFIDAGHTYRECTADFDNAHQYCVPGTIVGFHDYGSRHWPDVIPAVEDIIKRTGAKRLLHVDTLYAIIL